jgi:peptidoglycan/xylan/chitin deacetylase (PgdA/CDA1 family)
MTWGGRVAGILGPLGLYRFSEIATRGRAPVLTYHRFRRAGQPGKGITSEQLERHLRIIRSRFEPRTFAEIVGVGERGEDVPKNALAVTIDDGYADVHEVALPLLEAYGVPATVFVVSGFVDRDLWLWPDRIENAIFRGRGRGVDVESGGRRYAVSWGDDAGRASAFKTLTEAAKALPDRERGEFVWEIEKAMGMTPGAPLPSVYAPMSWEQVRDCGRRGIEIGSHTVTHPILSLQSRDEQAREIRESKAILEDRLQSPVTTIAYPNGQPADFNEETKGLVRDAGYRAAASTVYGFSRPNRDDFAVRRMTARSDLRGFRQVVSGLQRYGAS